MYGFVVFSDVGSRVEFPPEACSSSSPECDTNPVRGHCDFSSNACVECISHEHCRQKKCAGGSPDDCDTRWVCDILGHVCVESPSIVSHEKNVISRSEQQEKNSLQESEEHVQNALSNGEPPEQPKIIKDDMFQKMDQKPPEIKLPDHEETKGENVEPDAGSWSSACVRQLSDPNWHPPVHTEPVPFIPANKPCETLRSKTLCRSFRSEAQNSNCCWFTRSKAKHSSCGSQAVLMRRYKGAIPVNTCGISTSDAPLKPYILPSVD